MHTLKPEELARTAEDLRAKTFNVYFATKGENEALHATIEVLKREIATIETRARQALARELEAALTAGESLIVYPDTTTQNLAIKLAKLRGVGETVAKAQTHLAALAWEQDLSNTSPHPDFAAAQRLIDSVAQVVTVS